MNKLGGMAVAVAFVAAAMPNPKRQLCLLIWRFRALIVSAIRCRASAHLICHLHRQRRAQHLRPIMTSLQRPLLFRLQWALRNILWVISRLSLLMAVEMT